MSVPITKEYAAECHKAGRAIMDCACWYRTAQINPEIDFDFRPFEKGQFVSVEWLKTEYNAKYGIHEDIFKIWSGTGEKYPATYFARALTSFCL